MSRQIRSQDSQGSSESKEAQKKHYKVFPRGCIRVKEGILAKP